jgi:hypothetical protein
MKPIVFIIALSCFLMLSSLAAGQVTEVPWGQVRDSEGIQVFTGKVAGDPIVIVKTQVVIDAGLERVKAVMDDEARYIKWVPYLVDTRILHRYSAVEWLQYNQFNAPWPATDRDLVYRVSVREDTSGVVIYTMQSEGSPLMPEHQGIVRALLKASTYTLTPINDHQTRVELIFHADPRGWVPMWIVNILHRSFPFLTLKRLREQIEHPPF